ncbi:MAG TPA: hypothetical protein VFK02_01250 [Kofleriaceae bacterium]|nr:hypothetical protein [Kofleriaceae bacterium]
MVRIRHGWLVAGLGLALAFGTACKKDGKTSDPAGKGDKGGDQTAEKPSGMTGPGAAADDLSLIPRDSELVLGLNLAQVQQSALWKQFVEPKLMTGDAAQKMNEFKAKCGFDPMSAIKSVSLGLKGVGNDNPDGVVVIHGVNKAKSWACLDSMKDEMTKDGTEYIKDGDVAIFKNKNKNDYAVAVTFINDSTALAVLGDKANAAGVKAAAAGGSALKSSPPFLDMYGKINTGDSLWLLMNGASKVFDKMAGLGVKPIALFGSLNVTDGLALDMRVRLETPDAAAQLANMGKAQLQQAAKMFDKADVTNDGADVRLSVVLSNQKLQALIAQFAGLVGAFGGMDGGKGTP